MPPRDALSFCSVRYQVSDPPSAALRITQGSAFVNNRGTDDTPNHWRKGLERGNLLRN